MQWHALTSLGLRFSAGHVLWSAAAFAFPGLTVLHDGNTALAMLLFIVETLMASALLGTRLLLSRYLGGRSPEAVQRLGEVRRVLLWLVLPCSLVGAVMLGVIAAIEAQRTDLGPHLVDAGERVRWMAVALVSSTVLDSVLAPVRSVHWLETGVAWQGSRTVVLFLSMLLGWPVMLATGASSGFFWIFFALRLFSDLGGLRRSERERIRAHLFGPPFAAGAAWAPAGGSVAP
ncbi:MAG: hypothetical protein H0V80_14375 [Acidobacteria bacterium]|nr:hypothetical protein [Acidobacteriota bacterium]